MNTNVVTPPPSVPWGIMLSFLRTGKTTQTTKMFLELNLQSHAKVTTTHQHTMRG